MTFDNRPMPVERNEGGFWHLAEMVDTEKSRLGLSYVLQGAPRLVHTGTVAATTVGGIIVPGGLLGRFGSVRYTALITGVASANAKPMGLRLGNWTNLSGSFFTSASTIGRVCWDFFIADGQILLPPGFLTTHAVAASAMTTAAIDTSQDWIAGLLVQLVSAADSITLEAWRLELFPSD